VIRPLQGNAGGRRPAGLAAGLLAALLLAACTPEQAPSAAVAPLPGLATAVIHVQPVATETLFDGEVEALQQATVTAQTSGRVEEMPFDVGDRVEKGQVIVRLRATEQDALAASAAATTREAQARLTEAQLAFERTQKLYRQDVVARAALDAATAKLKSARAAADAAQAGQRQARTQIDYTTVHAPYSGIVVQRHIKLGEIASAGRPLITGLSLEHLRVVVDVPQQQIGPLRRQGPARVILADGRSVAVAALRVPPAADPATHSFRVLATLPEGDHGVFPGTLVKLAFVSGEQAQLLLPPTALVHRGEVTGVYVLEPQGQFALRYLRVGSAVADGRIPVLAGLADGESVALDPVAAAAALQGAARAAAR